MNISNVIKVMVEDGATVNAGDPLVVMIIILLRLWLRMEPQ